MSNTPFGSLAHYRRLNTSSLMSRREYLMRLSDIPSRPEVNRDWNTQVEHIDLVLREREEGPRC